MIRAAGGKTILPSAAPAVAVAQDQNWFGSLGDRVFCAWVDDSYTLWTVSANQANAMRNRDWSHLPWEKPELVATHVDKTKGPALLHYNGGLSTGVYCVYVSNTGELRCQVKLYHGANFGFGYWTSVPFDKPRSRISRPLLPYSIANSGAPMPRFPPDRTRTSP